MAEPEIPLDDGERSLTIASPDDPELQHLGVAGGTYTVLIRGADTAGQYALIDMLVPPDAGPPPHRHAFEEMFHVLEGEVELTLRDGPPWTAVAGDTVNVPALAPHAFRNTSKDQFARLLCMVSPAGLEDLFAAIGDELESRTTKGSPPDPAVAKERMAKAAEITARLGIEAL